MEEIIELEFTGQITIDQSLGKEIYELTKLDNVKTIVDVGTFNGLGSTLCIIVGMNENQKLYSIELYPDMYKLALSNLSKVLNPNIKILNGRIIEYNDVFWFDHKKVDLIGDIHANLWYHKDLQHLKNSKNVINELPNVIDLLVLDGGEYTTYPEYLKLKDRSNIIVLDDVNILKCAQVRHELLNNNDFELTHENLQQRNGYSIFRRKEWITQE